MLFDSRDGIHGRVAGASEAESSAEVTKLVVAPIGQGQDASRLHITVRNQLQSVGPYMLSSQPKSLLPFIDDHQSQPTPSL